MAFGQRSGPPATARQIQELVQLLQEAGHTDFRDARGPMGFTQRQAGGAFTRDEAESFIERLRSDAPEESQPVSAPAPRSSARERMLRDLPAEQLAGELRRRGWTAIEP
jgi:hypothetical protein